MPLLPSPGLFPSGSLLPGGVSDTPDLSTYVIPESHLAVPGEGYSAANPTVQMDVSGQWIFHRQTATGYQPMLVLNRGNFGLDDPQTTYGSEFVRIMSITGVDADVIDRREPIVGDHGEVAYPGRYAPRNLVFDCRITAGNLARVREILFNVKRALIPFFGASVGTLQYKSTPFLLTYVMGNNTGAIGDLAGNVGVDIEGYVVDFVAASEKSQSMVTTQDFQMTVRCPDPRFYTYPRAFRIAADRVTIVANDNSFADAVSSVGTWINYGNADVPCEVWLGDYDGDGSGAWSITNPFISTRSHFLAIGNQAIPADSETVSGGAGDYVYINSRKKYVLDSTTVFSAAANLMPQVNRISHGWLRQEPTERNDLPIVWGVDRTSHIQWVCQSSTGSPVLSYYPVSAFV